MTPKEKFDDLHYNVVILRNWVAYLKSQLNWSNAQVEQLFEQCHSHVSFLDSDDNWFGQKLADDINERVVQLTGDPDIARKVGVFALHESVRGIAGNIVSSLLSPRMIFKNIGTVSGYYSKAATLSAVSVARGSAIIRSEPNPFCVEQPYQCQNRIGMLEAAPTLFHANQIRIEHPVCLHKGAKYCQYDIYWSSSWKSQPGLITAGITLLALAALVPTLGITQGLLATLFTSLASFVVLREISIQHLSSTMRGQNATLKESLNTLNRRHEEATILRQTVESTIEMMPLGSLSEVVVHSIKEKMKYDRAIILLVDGTVLRTQATAGYQEKYAHLIKKTEFNIDPNNFSGYFIRAINTKKPLLVRNVQQNLDQLSGRSRDLAKALNTDSFIAAPMVFHEEVLGVLAVENDKTSVPLSHNDLQLMTALASNIAVAIANARSYQETNRALKLNQDLRNLFQKYVPSEMRVDDNTHIDDIFRLEQKVLGIMFIDLVGFTSLSEKETPDRIAKTLNIYIDEVQKQVEAHGGRINKIMGDGMLIYFDPTTSNVIHAGGAILGAMAAINRRLTAEKLPQISVGVGAHKGLCTLGNIGSVNRLDYTLIGDAVNVASRIESYTRKTGPNTFCFSKVLMDQAQDCETTPCGDITLKGHREPIEIIQYLGPTKVKKVA